MSFGLQFINTSDVVTLDSEFARMCVVASGRLAGTFGSSNTTSINTFPAPITTQEPPLVFVRLDNPGNSLVGSLAGFVPQGSPGNWTGFVTGSAYINIAPPTFAPGDWFACQMGGKAAASYGLRMWDGGSRVIFDSGTPAALFTRAAQNWAYVKSDQAATGYFRNYYVIENFTFDPSEFQMINQFGMPLIASVPENDRGVLTWWDWPAGRLWAVTGSFHNTYAFNLPALFAKR